MGTWILRAAGGVFWFFALTSSGYATLNAVHENNYFIATICFSLMLLLSFSGQSFKHKRAAMTKNNSLKNSLKKESDSTPFGDAVVLSVNQQAVPSPSRVRASDFWSKSGQSDHTAKTIHAAATPAAEWENGTTVQGSGPPSMIMKDDSILSLRAMPLEEGESVELRRQLRITFCREDYSVVKRLINAQHLVRYDGQTWLEAHSYSDCADISFKLERILEIHDKRSGVTQTEEFEEWLTALALTNDIKEAAE
ncbi:MAG: hypothetical protein ABJN26_05665 [Stappiaceae bacterium]